MILALLQPIQKLRLLQILFTSSMIYTMAESNPRLNLFILNDMKFSHQIEKSSVITIYVKRHFIVHPINLTNSTYSCREKAYLGTSIVRGMQYLYTLSLILLYLRDSLSSACQSLTLPKPGILSYSAVNNRFNSTLKSEKSHLFNIQLQSIYTTLINNI